MRYSYENVDDNELREAQQKLNEKVRLIDMVEDENIAQEFHAKSRALQEIYNLKQSIKLLRDIVDKDYGRLKREIEEVKLQLKESGKDG